VTDWFTHMRRGDFTAAWAISDGFLGTGVWDGTPLAGRRVHIRCEHGLGDTIMFARFFPLVNAIASECTIAVQPSLIPLLQAMPGIGRLGEPETYDVEVECMELAHVFRTTVETIPPAPYLHVTPFLWSGGRLGRRIGVVWRAGDWNPIRSIPRALIERLPFTHSLQLGESDLPVDTPLSTAQVMRALDLVITVDTMTAHLAGALGVPVFTLLPHDHDWRWMDDRTDSPWYPSMRLFRQPRPGDWDAVIDEVRYAISTMADETDETKKDTLNEWGIDVDKFKERAKESMAGAKDDLSEIAGTLRHALVSAKDVVLGLQSNGAPAAAELKSGFERAWKEIESAFRAARDKAKGTPETTHPPPDSPPPSS
jgi:hypothetical protein